MHGFYFSNRCKMGLSILLIMFFSPCWASNKCSPQDTQAITQSIDLYLKSNSAISPDNIDINQLRCIKSYSSAQLIPRDKSTDNAKVYLHKTSGKWNVMSLGTDFDESFLKTIPKELR